MKTFIKILIGLVAVWFVFNFGDFSDGVKFAVLFAAIWGILLTTC